MGSGDKILDFFLLNSYASIFPVVIFLKVINLVLHDINVAWKLFTFPLFYKLSLPYSRIQESYCGVGVIGTVGDYVVFLKL
jgi:hypothetical protein